MRKAFTLIELLVVVAIIAILISILVPALGRARAQAKQVVCGTNLRNVVQATLQYAGENRDLHCAVWNNEALRFRAVFGNLNYLLPSYTINAGTGEPQSGGAYWATHLDKYLGVYVDPRYFTPSIGIGSLTKLPGWENTRCPEARYTLRAFRRKSGTAGNPNGAESAFFNHDPYTLYSTYCFNGVAPGFDSIPDKGLVSLFQKSASGKRVPGRITDIKYAAQMILAQDGSEVMLDGNGDTLVQFDQWNNDSEMTADERKDWVREYFRHPGGCEVVWVDGHVSNVPRTLAQERRKELYRTYNTDRGVPLPWYTAPY